MNAELLATLTSWTLLANVAATFYLVGLIWFVQRVHYPLFSEVGEQQFAAYERAHVTRTTPVVAPAMLIEAGTAAVLVLVPPAGIPVHLTWIGLGLVVAIWLSTFSLQVPRHDELRGGFDARAHAQLVGTNWIRTVLWTLRGMLCLWMLLEITDVAARAF